MKRASLLVALLALLSAVACEKKETPAQPAAETSVAPPAPVSAPPPPPPTPEPVVDVSTLPVEEQFEANAEQEITAANVAAKIDEIEKEIGP